MNVFEYLMASDVRFLKVSVNFMFLPDVFFAMFFSEICFVGLQCVKHIVDKFRITPNELHTFLC